jgi:putative aminopeptidase FrvX
MLDETVELLRELTEASGISGYEQEVREIIRKHLQKKRSLNKTENVVCRKRVFQTPT